MCSRVGASFAATSLRHVTRSPHRSARRQVAHVDAGAALGGGRAGEHDLATQLAGVAAAFLAWALLSILWVPPYLVTANPYRVDLDPSSRGLVFETIRIPSEDLLLEGWWIPAESPRAELIFVHGAGSNRISQFVGSLDFYRTLHDMGVSVVTMDLRNHGNSGVTDGMLGMGAKEWPDLSAAAIWLDQHQPSELPRL